MSNETDQLVAKPATPPPIPPQQIGYATPTGNYGQPQPDTTAHQKVFDTVLGPNVRVKDNVIQLLCVIVGACSGAAVGYFAFGGPVPALVGVIVGLFGALVLSGAVIGILRFRGALKK